MTCCHCVCCCFFFNDTATTEIYTYDTLFPYTTLFRSCPMRQPNGATEQLISYSQRGVTCYETLLRNPFFPSRCLCCCTGCQFCAGYTAQTYEWKTDRNHHGKARTRYEIGRASGRERVGQYV